MTRGLFGLVVLLLVSLHKVGVSFIMVSWHWRCVKYLASRWNCSQSSSLCLASYSSYCCLFCSRSAATTPSASASRPTPTPATSITVEVAATTFITVAMNVITTSLSVGLKGPPACTLGRSVATLSPSPPLLATYLTPSTSPCLHLGP